MPINSADIEWDGSSPDIEWDEPKPPRARTLTEEFKRQLGLTARAGVEGVTGTAGVVGDALNTLVNFALPQNKQLQMPSQMMQKGLENVGLPKPETPLEHIAGFGAQMLAGGGDPLTKAAQAATTAKYAAPAGFKPPVQAANDQVAKELHDSGLKLLPTQSGGHTLTRSMEGVGGVERLSTLLRNENQRPIQALAARATGQRPENITEAALDAASRQVSSSTYEPIRNLQTIRMGRAYKNELDKIGKEFASIDQTPQIKRRLRDLYVNKLPADATLERIAQLRSDAADAFRGDNRNYGKALRKMADALENQIERNLPANSEILANYRAGRTQIAKNNAVKEMLVDKHTGIIDTTKAHKLLEDGVPLSGELRTIAKAGSPMFSSSTKPPVKGEGVPFNWGDAWMSSGAGVAGMMGAGPIGLTAMAAPPMARAASRRLLASQPVQNAMARNLSPSGSSFFGLPPELAQRLPLSAIPYFSQGGE